MPTIDYADQVTEEVRLTLKDQYTYHSWSDEKIAKGEQVRAAIMNAAAVIIASVPPSADRSTALRKLREARMDCNSAITHDGKY